MSKSAGERITFCVYRKTSKRRPWAHFVFGVIYGLHSVFGAIYGLHSVFGAIDGLRSVFGAIYGLHSVFGAIYGLHSEMDFFLRCFFSRLLLQSQGESDAGASF